jgi:V/A-type H+-transporting ATPase subunit E
MALDNVKKDITGSAEETVRAINAERDAEIARITAEADAVISDMRKKEDKRLKEAIAHLGLQELSSAELESKKIVLAKKKEILSQAFAEALEELESAPPKVRTERYKKMVSAAKNVIKEPKAYCAKDETIKAEDIGVTSLTKLATISGGLVLESKDGTIRLDMQYRSILQTIWDSEMKRMSEILFG